MLKTKSIKLTDIRLDGGTQQRCEINNQIVKEYAEEMKCGAKFPPVTVFFDGVVYWLADGFHRYHASVDIGATDIEADVHVGTNRVAILYSTGANNTHGPRLTNDDKRKAVGTLLSDKEWSSWSDRDIAKHCKVTHPFVAKLRNPEGLVTTNKVVTVTTKPPKAAPGENENATSATEATSSDEVAGDPHPALPQETPEAEQEYTELDAAHDQISALQDMVAVGYMDATTDEKNAATELIKELKAEVKRLGAEVQILTAARDGWQNQAAALKQQVVRQSRELSKLTGQKR